jgi:hypothetical protein
MSGLSPLWGAERKLVFEAVRSVDDPERTSDSFHNRPNYQGAALPTDLANSTM